MDIKPPVKPSKDADHNAFLAYHSELRRYHRQLEEWDAKLRQQQTVWKIERLKEIINGKPTSTKATATAVATPKLPGPECGCSIRAAAEGCDCPECEQWRKDFKITSSMVDDWSLQDIIAHAKKVFMGKKSDTVAAPVTDEMSKFFAQYEEQLAHPERDDEQRKNN